MFDQFSQILKSRLSSASSQTWCNIYTCMAFFVRSKPNLGMMSDQFKSHSYQKSPENNILGVGVGWGGGGGGDDKQTLEYYWRRMSNPVRRF